MRQNYNLFGGFDPSARKKGFAMCILDYQEKTAYFKTFKNYLAFLSWFLHDRPDSMVVCVENSNLQNEFFYTHRARKTGALLTRKQSRFIPCRPLRPAEREKANRDVGKNQMASQICYDLFCSVDAYYSIEISPKQKGSKWDVKKMGRKIYEFELKREGLTPNKNKLNQDETDSLQIALKGRSIYKLNKLRFKIPLK